MPDAKTIQVRSSTKKRLDRLGAKGDTYDEIIRKLIAFFEKSNGAANHLNINGRNLHGNHLGNSGVTLLNGSSKKDDRSDTREKPPQTGSSESGSDSSPTGGSEA